MRIAPDPSSLTVALIQERRYGLVGLIDHTTNPALVRCDAAPRPCPAVAPAISAPPVDRTACLCQPCPADAHAYGVAADPPHGPGPMDEGFPISAITPANSMGLSADSSGVGNLLDVFA